MANIFNVGKKSLHHLQNSGLFHYLLHQKVYSSQGHTECLAFTQIAGLTPVTAICEMMDAETYTALSVDKAEKFAKQKEFH